MICKIISLPLLQKYQLALILCQPCFCCVYNQAHQCRPQKQTLHTHTHALFQQDLGSTNLQLAFTRIVGFSLITKTCPHTAKNCAKLADFSLPVYTGTMLFCGFFAPTNLEALPAAPSFAYLQKLGLGTQLAFAAGLRSIFFTCGQKKFCRFFSFDFLKS